MPEFWSAFAGAGVGGLFALLGGWLQGKQQLRTVAAQFDQQRRLAVEEHSRNLSVAENERVRTRIDEQLRHGRRVAGAATQFRARYGTMKTEDEAEDVLEEAMRIAGFDPNAPVPYPDFLSDLDLEDDELRRLIREHKGKVVEIDVLLISGRIERTELPSFKELGEVDDLARRIEARFRALQREGKPI